MPPRPDEPTFRDYLLPLWRWRYLVVAFTVLATVATYVYYDREPVSYVAGTRILVTAASNPLDPNATDLSDRTLQNQAALLKSRDVATQVARTLGRPGEIDSLAASVQATASEGSDFVDISATRASSTDAADVANAFARAFIKLRTDAARKQLDQALSLTRAQLAALPRTTINAAQRAELQNTARELQLSSQVSNGSASQVDPALPGAAIAQHVTRNAALAFILAFVGSAGLAYAVTALDTRPRRLEELSPLYGLPVLSVLPHTTTTPAGDGARAVDPVLKEPLRQLRTNLQLAALDEPFRRVLVTSAVAGEGKSTVVRNLALVLSEGGQRVVIVDGDLRRPTLASGFGQPSSPGLTNVLTGSVTLEDALVSIPTKVAEPAELAPVSADGAGAGLPGLAGTGGSITLLPSGPQPADPQTVLSADSTRDVLVELARDFDVVLIDSPPLLHVTDAIALAAWSDAVVIVARLGQVTRPNIARVPEMLTRSTARPVGLVVNDIPAADSQSYGYGAPY